MTFAGRRRSRRRTRRTSRPDHEALGPFRPPRRHPRDTLGELEDAAAQEVVAPRSTPARRTSRCSWGIPRQQRRGLPAAQPGPGGLRGRALEPPRPRAPARRSSSSFSSTARWPACRTEVVRPRGGPEDEHSTATRPWQGDLRQASDHAAAQARGKIRPAEALSKARSEETLSRGRRERQRGGRGRAQHRALGHATDRRDFRGAAAQAPGGRPPARPARRAPPASSSSCRSAGRDSARGAKAVLQGTALQARSRATKATRPRSPEGIEVKAGVRPRHRGAPRIGRGGDRG